MNAERAVIESTYDDICTIYNYEKTKNNGLTQLVPVQAHENIPCALSQKTLKPTAQSESQNVIDYDQKLFLSPDIVVKPGCKIEVRRMGRDYVFESTGEPFVYPSHQEVMLKRLQRA